METNAASVENKAIIHSMSLLDQIGVVWMNSMLVLLEQATDVICPEEKQCGPSFSSSTTLSSSVLGGQTFNFALTLIALVQGVD